MDSSFQNENREKVKQWSKSTVILKCTSDGNGRTPFWYVLLCVTLAVATYMYKQGKVILMQLDFWNGITQANLIIWLNQWKKIFVVTDSVIVWGTLHPVVFALFCLYEASVYLNRFRVQHRFVMWHASCLCRHVVNRRLLV
jgi:hypothetical protein